MKDGVPTDLSILSQYCMFGNDFKCFLKGQLLWSWAVFAVSSSDSGPVLKEPEVYGSCWMLSCHSCFDMWSDMLGAIEFKTQLYRTYFIQCSLVAPCKPFHLWGAPSLVFAAVITKHGLALSPWLYIHTLHTVFSIITRLGSNLCSWQLLNVELSQLLWHMINLPLPIK